MKAETAAVAEAATTVTSVKETVSSTSSINGNKSSRGKSAIKTVAEAETITTTAAE